MADQEEIPPNRNALKEALILSEEILKNIELGELALTNIALKAIRLSRLLNDFDMQKKSFTTKSAAIQQIQTECIQQFSKWQLNPVDCSNERTINQELLMN